MKYLKILGIAAAAAAALMAFVGAGTASATVLCSTQSAPCNSKWPTGTTLEFTASSSGLLKETGAEGETLDTCKKTKIKWTITVSGGSGNVHVAGTIGNLTQEECTWTTTTIQNGGLEVVSTGSHNGTVKANSEIRVTISIPFFGSCVYGVTAGSTVGTTTEGNPSTFDGGAVASKLSGSSITCPATANWSGTYTQTAPASTTLSVEAS